MAALCSILLLQATSLGSDRGALSFSRFALLPLSAACKSLYERILSSRWAHGGSFVCSSRAVRQFCSVKVSPPGMDTFCGHDAFCICDCRLRHGLGGLFIHCSGFGVLCLRLGVLAAKVAPTHYDQPVLNLYRHNQLWALPVA